MTGANLVIILFGASGDLAARKLYPAIYRLYKKGQISDNFALIGTSRSNWSTPHFREVVLQSIDSEIVDNVHAQEFISHLYYQAHDVYDANHYYKLKNLAEQLDERYQTKGNRMFYISLAPKLFPVISSHIKSGELLSHNGFNRLIIEKPFGHDLKSAQTLQNQLIQTFDEEQIYRIDHYLGKEIVHSLRYLRFNNHVLRNLWDRDGIHNVQIVLDEEVGVGERSGYYDHAGVSRDMIQNHLLQILSLAAMNQPQDDTAQSLRQEKINILSHLRPYRNAEEVRDNVIRGQYGLSEDGILKGYRQENGVANDSTTETFLAARVFIDLPSWKDVPFFIRSGKRMTRKVSVINIVFKNDMEGLEPNRLRIEIGPNLSYQLFINSKKPGYDHEYESICFQYNYSSKDVEAMPVDYERLIFESIQGDLNNFNHYQEIENAWRFVDSMVAGFDQYIPEFPNYPANSQGPQAAHDLLAKYGTRWYD